MSASLSEPESEGSPHFSIKAVGKSTAVLAVGVLIGQVFGVLRVVFVAGEVGISSAFDAVLVALVVPTILASWLSNALRVAIVPAYVHIADRAGTREARRFVGAVLTYLGIASVIAVVLVLGGADLVIDVSGPGLTREARDLAVLQVPVLAPMLAFMALSNLLVAVCQIGRRFVPIASASALGGLVGLLATVGLWGHLGITAYAVGATLDALFSLGVMAMAAARDGILPRPTLRADLAEVRAFARHVLPMTLGSAVLQLNLISDRAIATLLSAGAASALKYGQQLVNAPAAALSTSWTTVIYPAVVAEGSPRSSGGMGGAMTVSLRYALAIFVPLAVGVAALAPVAVGLIYGRGAFGVGSVWTTTAVVVAFAPMLVLSMAQPVFVAAHNARRRGVLMAATGVSNAILNVVLNLVFGSLLGAAGIALSSSVTLTILLLFLASRVPAEEGFDGRAVVAAGGRALAASLVPGLPVAAIAWSLPVDSDAATRAVMIIACAATGAAAYIVVAARLGLEEPRLIYRAMRGRAALLRLPDRLLRSRRG